MSACTRFALLGLLLLSATGCGLTRPRWFPAGPVQFQRQNATVHDPYTDNDAGPEVVGGRPKDYQKPLAEPVRSRPLTENWWQG